MLLRFMKKVDKRRNRMIIPKFIINKFGSDYYMEVNTETGEMKLIPIKTAKEGE